MPLSMYHSASGSQSPHCLHFLGIGKMGATMLDSMLRQGDLEDQLDDPRARFTALLVDIGEQDMLQVHTLGSSLRFSNLLKLLPESF